MSMIPKRLLVTAALGAALASTSIGETRAMQIPVTTADAIASPALTEQVNGAATAGAAGGAAAGGAATAGAATAGAATAGVAVDGEVAPWRLALSRAG